MFETVQISFTKKKKCKSPYNSRMPGVFFFFFFKGSSLIDTIKIHGRRHGQEKPPNFKLTKYVNSSLTPLLMPHPSSCISYNLISILRLFYSIKLVSLDNKNPRKIINRRTNLDHPKTLLARIKTS